MLKTPCLSKVDVSPLFRPSSPNPLLPIISLAVANVVFCWIKQKGVYIKQLSHYACKINDMCNLIIFWNMNFTHHNWAKTASFNSLVSICGWVLHVPKVSKEKQQHLQTHLALSTEKIQQEDRAGWPKLSRKWLYKHSFTYSFLFISAQCSICHG